MADQEAVRPGMPGRTWSPPALAVLATGAAVLLSGTAVFLGALFLSVAPPTRSPSATRTR